MKDFYAQSWQDVSGTERRAEWLLVDTAAGGREGPLFSGYRGNLSVGERIRTGSRFSTGATPSLRDASNSRPARAGQRTYFLFREHAEEWARHSRLAASSALGKASEPLHQGAFSNT